MIKIFYGNKEELRKQVYNAVSETKIP